LVFKPIPDPQVAMTNLYAGAIDIVAEPSTAVVSQIDETKAHVIRPIASNSIVYIEMMGTKGTLANVHLRRALAYAFDRETIKSVAYGGQGDSVASPLPTGSFAYVNLDGYPYNLDRAKEELALSGAPDGVEINLEVLSGFPEAEQMGRVWQSSLAKVGIKLNVVVSELSVWLDRYVSRNYDMTWNFFGVSPDPHSFFDVILRPHLSGEYQNQKVVDLVRQGIENSSNDERKAIYGQLQEIMVEDLPVMAVQSRPIASIASKSIKGLELNPLGWPLYAGATKTE
jgi:peptide/nickel transport system substrate-binding protein